MGGHAREHPAPPRLLAGGAHSATERVAEQRRRRAPGCSPRVAASEGSGARLGEGAAAAGRRADQDGLYPRVRARHQPGLPGPRRSEGSAEHSASARRGAAAWRGNATARACGDEPARGHELRFVPRAGGRGGAWADGDGDRGELVSDPRDCRRVSARAAGAPPPLRPPTPTPPPPTHPNHPKAGDKPVGVDGETGGKWGQLRPVREMVRNFRRGDTTSDHVRVANMENAVGMQLFTLCSLESPFPEALFE